MLFDIEALTDSTSLFLAQLFLMTQFCFGGRPARKKKPRG